jgi:hypothetical protein
MFMPLDLVKTLLTVGAFPPVCRKTAPAFLHYRVLMKTPLKSLMVLKEDVLNITLRQDMVNPALAPTVKKVLKFHLVGPIILLKISCERRLGGRFWRGRFAARCPTRQRRPLGTRQAAQPTVGAQNVTAIDRKDQRKGLRFRHRLAALPGFSL